MKLTSEQIKAIPERLKTSSVASLAAEYKCRRSSIYRWIDEYEKRGKEIIIHKKKMGRPSFLDKQNQ